MDGPGGRGFKKKVSERGGGKIWTSARTSRTREMHA